MTAPHWRLHVTVEPHWNWSLADVTSALKRDIERHGIKPVVLTNHFRDSARKPYKEIIPTRHFEGTEAEATREIFHMGVLLNNSGWRVKRLKIEGDPTHHLNPTDEQSRHGACARQRALYYEAHVKMTGIEVLGVAHQLGAAFSTTVRSAFATFRHPAMGNVYTRAMGLIHHMYGLSPDRPPLHIEAAVLDTAPELDDDWLRS